MRTAGIPALAPEPEAVDPIGVTTNVVQVLGLALALTLTQTMAATGRPIDQEAP